MTALPPAPDKRPPERRPRLVVLAVGIGSGLVAALLFASVLSGSVFSVLLFYAAPLPIMIAALGWRHLAGLVSAIVGSLALGIALTPLTGFVFAVAVALPAWLLGYLSLLGRREGERVTEWFPVGTVVAAAAVIGIMLGLVAALSLGTTYAEYHDALAKGIEMVLRAQSGTPDGKPLVIPEVGDVGRLIAVLQAVLPPAVVAMWVLTTLIDLWIAGRVVRASSRLVRPWPDLPALDLPRWAGIILVGGVLASALPGWAGLGGELAAATFGVAFMLQGLAVVHAITRGQRARGFVLAGLYFACLVLSWLTIGLAILGLAEQAFHLRARASRGPVNDNRNP